MAMEHRTTAGFWQRYSGLPKEVRTRADKQFALLKTNSQHPSLQLKKVGERQGGEVWSSRITLNYRALAVKRDYGYLWFWIGDHKAYEDLLS